MQISTNPTQYQNYQVGAQSAVQGGDGGQDVPGPQADPAPATARATAAAGSTPASQFSQAVLSQLIQTQAGAQAQGLHHGRHGHHHHAQEAGQTAPADASAASDSSGAPADASTTDQSGGPTLAAAILN